MIRIAAGHGPLALVYRRVDDLELPSGTDVVVAADIDGTRQSRPIPLDALTATLAQLPDHARNVEILTPTVAAPPPCRHPERQRAASLKAMALASGVAPTYLHAAQFVLGERPQP